MKRLAVLITILLSFAASAQGSIVVNFDDLAGRDTVPDGYGGITWGTDWLHWDFPQAPYYAHSGSERVATQTTSSSFSFATDVVFEGAWFASWSRSVQFALFDKSVPVHTTDWLLMPAGDCYFLASGYSGPVDRVEVHFSYAGQTAMDDVTYTPITPTPEPSTIIIWSLLGGISLSYACRKRMATQSD